MSSAVNIITTCVSRKAITIPKRLCLRDIKGSNVRERISEWYGRLNENKGMQLPAEDLYKGDHWQVVKTLVESARQGEVGGSLWITSAGYGIIRSNALLCPYAATFSPYHMDSVNSGLSEERPGEIAKKWWKQMSGRRGPEHGVPRSIESIANEMPSRSILVIASANYISAMYDDLLAARSGLNDPEKLIIISAGANHLEKLEENRLPCDARMQSVVHGSRISLNARIGRKVLKEAARWPLQISTLRDRYKGLIARQPDIKKYDRRPMSDSEIIKYIRIAIKQTPDLSATRMLRMFRDNGNACEQKRFGNLFSEVRGEG